MYLTDCVDMVQKSHNQAFSYVLYTERSSEIGLQGERYIGRCKRLQNNKENVLYTERSSKVWLQGKRYIRGCKCLQNN